MQSRWTESEAGLDRASQVRTELSRRRADLVDHGRTSLAQHLFGVFDVLARWGQLERVRLAGLLHSAYSTEAFRFRLFGTGERARVRELIGRDAERLVFAFGGCAREALVEAASRGAPVRLPTRWEKVSVDLDARALGELMVLHVANLAEQSCAPRGGPSSWLVDASRMLRAANGNAEVVPPVLGDREAITPLGESDLLREYAALLRLPLAPPRLDASIVESPVGEPRVIAGLALLANGDGAKAAKLAAEGKVLLERWGTPWDKRLAHTRWLELAELVARDGRLRDRELAAVARRAKGALERARGSPARVWAGLDALDAFPRRAPELPAPSPPSPARASLPPRFAAYIAGLRDNHERPLMHFYPGLRARPWHDPREFPIVKDLERLAPAIAKEAASFDPSRFHDEAEPIGREGRWGVLFFLEMGRRRADHLASCPSLRWILEHHRTLTTHAGLMYLSALDPKTRVAPHRGPTNVRVRCHLGLDVPEGCGIRVGGVARTWEEGRCLVIDDSFNHEVWNDSDRRRLILVLDLWHPDLEEDEVALLSGLHRYGAANRSSAERYWAKNEAARQKLEEKRPDDPVSILDREVGAALRSGDLERAGEKAKTYAALTRGSRWHPVRRDDDPPLPHPSPWTPVLTPGKLRHDLAQLEYLEKQGVLGDDLSLLRRRYASILDRLRPLGDEARVPLVGAALAQVGHAYGRLLHVRETPRVPRALSRSWEGPRVEDEYLASRPNVVVVDDFLTPEALAGLRLFCLESTVWSTNRYDHGRLGSFFRDGFNCPLLLQVGDELRSAFPRVIGARHPVAQIWGYKYAPVQPELPPHADFAAVNVNFWLTPDDANLDPGGGGLLLYDVAAPRDWDFATYNRDGRRIRALLQEKGATETRIPYRQNRAVIFDSDLFHATPALRFRDAYEDRRVNVTFLFGDRLKP